MGYFSSGSEGDAYEAKYCKRCVHLHPEFGCPCINAHQMWNYDECNKPDSVLHKMIPPTGGGFDETFNGECRFFREKPDA